MNLEQKEDAAFETNSESIASVSLINAGVHIAGVVVARLSKRSWSTGDALTSSKKVLAATKSVLHRRTILIVIHRIRAGREKFSSPHTEIRA